MNSSISTISSAPFGGHRVSSAALGSSVRVDLPTSRDISLPVGLCSQKTKNFRVAFHAPGVVVLIAQLCGTFFDFSLCVNAFSRQLTAPYENKLKRTHRKHLALADLHSFFLPVISLCHLGAGRAFHFVYLASGQNVSTHKFSPVSWSVRISHVEIFGIFC